MKLEKASMTHRFSYSINLFYKLYEKTPVTEKYLLVVIKTVNREGFIVTAFFTDRVKKGGVVWKKKL